MLLSSSSSLSRPRRLVVVLSLSSPRRPVVVLSSSSRRRPLVVVSSSSSSSRPRPLVVLVPRPCHLVVFLPVAVPPSPFPRRRVPLPSLLSLGGGCWVPGAFVVFRCPPVVPPSSFPRRLRSPVPSSSSLACRWPVVLVVVLVVGPSLARRPRPRRWPVVGPSSSSSSSAASTRVPPREQGLAAAVGGAVLFVVVPSLLSRSRWPLAHVFHPASRCSQGWGAGAWSWRPCLVLVLVLVVPPSSASPRRSSFFAGLLSSPLLLSSARLSPSSWSSGSLLSTLRAEARSGGVTGSGVSLPGVRC